MIELDFGGFLWVSGFASQVASRNTIKIPSDGFLFRPLLIIDVLRL
jgi:hypothetical protein